MYIWLTIQYLVRKTKSLISIKTFSLSTHFILQLRIYCIHCNKLKREYVFINSFLSNNWFLFFLVQENFFHYRLIFQSEHVRNYSAIYFYGFNYWGVDTFLLNFAFEKIYQNSVCDKKLSSKKDVLTKRNWFLTIHRNSASLLF